MICRACPLTPLHFCVFDARNHAAHQARSGVHVCSAGSLHLGHSPSAHRTQMAAAVDAADVQAPPHLPDALCHLILRSCTRSALRIMAQVCQLFRTEVRAYATANSALEERIQLQYASFLHAASPRVRARWTRVGQKGSLLSEKTYRYVHDAVKTHADANARSCPWLHGPLSRTTPSWDIPPRRGGVEYWPGGCGPSNHLYVLLFNA